MIRHTLPVALAFTLLSASAPIAGAQSVTPPDPTPVLQQLVAGFNRNDRPAILSMFTDGAVVIGGPCGGAPGGECVGRSQIAQTLDADTDPVNVTLTDLHVGGDGNVVTFRTHEVFELPAEAHAAGIQRMVETGTAVIQDGKVDRLALVLDVTDPQTVKLQHIWAALAPPPSGMSGAAAATDGQTLAMQSAATQAMFRTLYGDQAPQQWAMQHQAALNAR